MMPLQYPIALPRGFSKFNCTYSVPSRLYSVDLVHCNNIRPMTRRTGANRKSRTVKAKEQGNIHRPSHLVPPQRQSAEDIRQRPPRSLSPFVQTTITYQIPGLTKTRWGFCGANYHQPNSQTLQSQFPAVGNKHQLHAVWLVTECIKPLLHQPRIANSTSPSGFGISARSLPRYQKGRAYSRIPSKHQLAKPRAR